tara:strand:- start:966 stop:1319 length:354 start_codon:yes stop_codon:yes gene_type:complete
MSKGTIIVWLDGIEVGAKIAKLATINSYDLELVDEIDSLGKLNGGVLIVDLNCINDHVLQNISKLKGHNFFTLLGFYHDLTSDVINNYSNFGFDIILERKEFLNNLDPIVEKAFHAC